MSKMLISLYISSWKLKKTKLLTIKIKSNVRGFQKSLHVNLIFWKSFCFCRGFRRRNFKNTLLLVYYRNLACDMKFSMKRELIVLKS